MKRILVTTDFSSAAEAAFPVAAAWAKRAGASLTVAYVVDSLEYNATYPYPDLTRFRDEIEAAAREGLSAAADTLRSLGAPTVDTVFRVGTPSVELAELATEDEGYDLMVLATHGATGFRRFLIGSVAEAVVRRVHCPVISVHTDPEQAPSGYAVRRILVATDLSELSDHGIRAAAEAATLWDAELCVVHAFRGPLPVAGMDATFTVPLSPEDIEAMRGAFLRGAEEQVERLGLTDRAAVKLLDAAHAAEGITQFASEEGYDLVVTASHGRRGIQRMIMGSVAERVMRMSDKPVLVVKAGE